MKTLVRQDKKLFLSLPSPVEDVVSRELPDSSLAERFFASLIAVNARDVKVQFIIDVYAPGMNRDDFKIELDQDVLTILSHREEKHEEKTEATNYTRKEFNYQSFQRSFSLPENKVDGQKITAKYIDGILQITVPKKDEAKVKP